MTATYLIYEGVARNPAYPFIPNRHSRFSRRRTYRCSLTVPEKPVGGFAIGKYPLRDGIMRVISSLRHANRYDNIKYRFPAIPTAPPMPITTISSAGMPTTRKMPPMVRELLGEVKDEALKQQLFDLFRIEPMLDKKIILSPVANSVSFS